MSVIAEYTIETPILQDALDAVPDMVLHTETIHLHPPEAPKGIFMAQGGDFQTFEQTIDVDPTIATFERLSTIDGRRLYRITFSEEGEAVLTYPVLAEHDGVLLDTTGTHEGLEIRARFPSREALLHYRKACKEREVPFHLHSLYLEGRIRNDGGLTGPYGVTDAQRDAILCALDLGYFAIPRQTTLADVADELGISTQAVSQRLRRGQMNVFQATLAR